MRIAFALTIIATVSACASSEEERQQTTIMDNIEKSVRLPPGSRHINRYARYYAIGADRNVRAVYLVPHGAFRAPYDLAAGQRRWIIDYNLLPAINDGGCDVIEFQFDPQSKSAVNPTCNGEA